MVIIPLALNACDSSLAAREYMWLATLATYSLFPLLFTPAEYPIKVPPGDCLQWHALSQPSSKARWPGLPSMAFAHAWQPICHLAHVRGTLHEHALGGMCSFCHSVPACCLHAQVLDHMPAKAHSIRLRLPAPSIHATQPYDSVLAGQRPCIVLKTQRTADPCRPKRASPIQVTLLLAYFCLGTYVLWWALDCPQPEASFLQLPQPQPLSEAGLGGKPLQAPAQAQPAGRTGRQGAELCAMQVMPGTTNAICMFLSPVSIFLSPE